MSLGRIGSNRFAVLAEPKKLNPEKALNSEDVKRKLDGELKVQFDGFLEECARRKLGLTNNYKSCRKTLVTKLQAFEGNLNKIIDQQIQKRMEDRMYTFVKTGAQQTAKSFINIIMKSIKSISLNINLIQLKIMTSENRLNLPIQD